MRLVVQVVSSASVSAQGTDAGGGYDEVAEVNEAGLLVLVGVTHDDTLAHAHKLADKVWHLRILAGERSCAELNAPLLVVSQFTLYADTRKGRRPSWNAAAPRPVSEPLVEAFVHALRELGARVGTGVFGAHMRVSLVNEGPVTLIIDSV